MGVEVPDILARRVAHGIKSVGSVYRPRSIAEGSVRMVQHACSGRCMRPFCRTTGTDVLFTGPVQVPPFALMGPVCGRAAAVAAKYSVSFRSFRPRFGIFRASFMPLAERFARRSKRAGR